MLNKVEHLDSLANTSAHSTPIKPTNGAQMGQPSVAISDILKP